MQKQANYRFQFQDTDSWKEYLQQNGFVVIANWLDEDTCSNFVNEFWGIMEKLSEGRLKKDDISTHTLSKNYPPNLHGGMIQYIGHSQPQWELRKLCKPIFQTLWNAEKVKTSFDGFCFMNGRRNYRKDEMNSFLHVDQSPTKDFLWSYQGVMTLTDSGEDQGGFVVVPKSHLYHQKYFREKGLRNHKQNWFLIPQKDKLKEPLSEYIKVNSCAGDFILFDSRSFHCNTKPTEECLRVCTYICMLPENKVPEKVKETRMKAAENRRTSNHHSGDGFKLFPSVPRYSTNPNGLKALIAEINSFDIEADEEIKQMI